MTVGRKKLNKSEKSRKFNDYPVAFDEELGYHRRTPAVVLDVPYLEDVYVQDLTNPIPNYEKRGFRPTWSRYTRLTEVNETRPEVLKEAKKLADEEWQDDQDDYRDPTAFRNIYR